MKALVIGATGATGKEIVQLLLNDPQYQQVTIFVRREVNFQHEKLKVHVIDFDTPETWSSLVSGNVLFSCLGTTLQAAGSKKAQWKIDYDYQYAFAQSASTNAVSTYVLISASNANPDSFFFYSKMKGKLEVAVKALSFNKLIIVRPPILDRATSDRTMEVLGVKIIRFLNKLGLLQNQKPMTPVTLAKAMITAVTTLKPGIHSLENKAIVNINNSLTEL